MITHTKYYLHADRDSNRDLGDELGLTESQMETFGYTGYEVSFDITIDDEGQAFATHVNGVALSTPVPI